MRHVLETVTSIESLLKHVDKVNIYLNDYTPMVAIRNLVMIYYLLTKGEEAIDLVINIWYSVAITSE